MIKLIEEISEHLKAQNMSKAELARRIGIDQEGLYRYLRGKRKPNEENARKIRIFLDKTKSKKPL